MPELPGLHHQSRQGLPLLQRACGAARGGAAGANQVAYKDATTFCAKQGRHAVVIEADARDVYQGAWGASNGYGSGGMFAAGNTDLHFRCAP